MVLYYWKKWISDIREQGLGNRCQVAGMREQLLIFKLNNITLKL
jgi:hypothetical protein